MEAKSGFFWDMYIFWIIIGFIGIISGLAVSMTPIIFKIMRNRIFLRILAVMSFCDILASLGFFLNIGRDFESRKNTALCQFQGLLFSFPLHATLSWTIALSLQLFSIIKYSKPYFSEMRMHVVFWSIPIFFTILPLFLQQRYGMVEYDYYENCFLYGSNKQIALVIDAISILGYILVSIFMLIYIHFLTLKALKENPSHSNTKLSEVLNLFKLYPLFIILLSLPIASLLVADAFSSSIHISSERFAVLNNATATPMAFYGIFTSIVFFYGSKDARHRWRTLICEFRIDNSMMPVENLRASLFADGKCIRLSIGDDNSAMNEHIIVDYDIDASETFISDAPSTEMQRSGMLNSSSRPP